MRRLYNIAYTILLWLRASLGLLELGKQGQRREIFAQRMGKFRPRTKQALTNRQMLWLHATSTESINLSTRLIAALEPQAPFLKLVVSTGSTAGMARLQSCLPGHIERIYLPFDLPRAVQRSLNVVHPEALVLLEPDLRPNLMWRLRQRRIPALLISGPLPPHLFRRYRRLSPLFKPLFASLAGVAVSDADTVDRLCHLGCRSKVTRIIGPWPEGAVHLGDRRPLDVTDLCCRIGFPPHATLLLGAATRPGEEELLAAVFLRLRQRHPDLFLVLVPHQYQRGKDVGRSMKRLGVRYLYRTGVTAITSQPVGSVDCLLVNTRGETTSFGKHASIVFVGGSMSGSATDYAGDDGSAIPDQAAAWGKPLIFGPALQDRSGLAEALVRNGAAVKAADPADLELAVGRILSDPALCLRMGECAIHTARTHLSPLEHAAEMILRQAAAENDQESPGTR